MSQYFNNFTVSWIIKNCSFFGIGKGGYVYSPIFAAENIAKTNWELCVFNNDGDDSGEYVSLQLRRCWETWYLSAMTLDIEMELCNSENEVLCSVEKKKGVQLNQGDIYTFSKVLLLEELSKKLEEDSSDTLILRCSIDATAEKPLSKNLTIQTTRCLDEVTYTREVDCSRFSPWSRKWAFPINETRQLNVNIKTHQDDILIEIRRENDKICHIETVKCEISLLDRKGIEKFSNYDSFTFSKNFRVWLFPPFLKKSFLEKDTSVLNLRFRFVISSGLEFHDHADETKNLSLPSSPKSFKKIPANSFLTDDLRKMLFSQTLADVSLCVDSEEITAHKFILASRSPVFSAMFDQNIAESENRVIPIADMSLQSLKLFLEFIYTGNLEDSDLERMMELLLAAEKYQIPSLKEKCSQFLKNQFNPDNVCDVVFVADKVGDQTLKAAAMNYIKGNVGEVLTSSKWSTFTKKNVDLCSEIFCNFSEDLKAKHVKTNICILEPDERL